MAALLTPASSGAAQLRGILPHSRVLHDACFTNFAVEPVGVGMIADSPRFRLRYDRGGRGISTVGRQARPRRSRGRRTWFAAKAACCRFPSSAISISFGALDVAYSMGFFLLSTDMPRRRECYLMTLYRKEFKKRDIRSHALAAFQSDYRVSLPQDVATVAFASASTRRTARCDAMFLSMPRVACVRAIDGDLLDALAA